MKKNVKWIALAAMLAVLLVFVSLVVLWSNWRQRPRLPAEESGANWVSDIFEPGNKARGHITVIGSPFHDGGELVWKTTFEVKGNPNRLEGIVGRYKSQASGEGKITLTLISKIREGKEIIKDQDRQPVVWHFKQNADGSLEIRRPFPESEVMFHFRKEN